MNLFFANVLEAAKFATASEVAVRENERMSVAGTSKARIAFSGNARVFNRQSTRAAAKALRILRKASKALDNPEAPLARLKGFHREQDAREVLAEAKEAFVHGLSEYDFRKTSEFSEVLAIWEEVLGVLSKEGVRGLFSRMEKDLQKFVDLRGQADRGNKLHSPLPWWKYVIIAAYIGAAAFAVFACFYWGACTWVWGAISATSPWLKNMIDWGC